MARVYNYEGEELCDRRMEVFLKAIDAASTMNGHGFVAIKVRRPAGRSRAGSRGWVCCVLPHAGGGHAPPKPPRTSTPCPSLPPAAQLTALGLPELLERVSNALGAIRGLFAQFDDDGNGFVSIEEFRRVYNDAFVDGDEDITSGVRVVDWLAGWLAGWLGKRSVGKEKSHCVFGREEKGRRTKGCPAPCLPGCGALPGRHTRNAQPNPVTAVV